MIPDNILLFIVLTTLVSMAPGPNVMFIMSQSALRGRRAGLMAGFGIQVANVFYFALTALGIGVLMSTSELAFFIVKWAGAGYLALLGVMAILRSLQRKLPPDPAQPSPVIAVGRGAFFDGLMIGLGNPKTIFWFLTFLPQFSDTKTDVLGQTVVLGTVGTIADLGVQWLYTHIGGALSRFLAKDHVRRWFERGVGMVFVALALIVAFAYKQH